MFSKSNNSLRVARVRLRDYEKPVRAGLAYKLSDMAAAIQKGLPVSQQNLDSMFFDGSPDVSYDLPSDEFRGVDIADLWQKAQTAKKHLSKTTIETFNINPQNA